MNAFQTFKPFNRFPSTSLTTGAPFNPDSAVEREVMSKEQTFRSEDNAFCL
jgi:hypothetical protein